MSRVKKNVQANFNTICNGIATPNEYIGFYKNFIFKLTNQSILSHKLVQLLKNK